MLNLARNGKKYRREMAIFGGLRRFYILITPMIHESHHTKGETRLKATAPTYRQV